MATSYRRSTGHGVNYTVNHTKFSAPAVASERRRCYLLLASVRGREPFYVSCLNCFAGNEVDYEAHYSERFYDRLSSLFPNIPSCCAEAVVDHFLTILKTVNERHYCPNEIRPAFHRVDIEVEPPSDASLEAALRASFEEAGPTTRPATKASVSRLVRPRALCDNCNQCAICMERMETRSSLEMPCCHVFHEACLVKWLDIDHVCPLCRYKMPSIDGLIDEPVAS